MKRVLFLTNVPSPYRVEFFNLLSNYCDLTVLYQKARSSERDKKWTAKSSGNYKIVFLKGKSVNSDSAICFEVTRYLKKDKYDHIIICGVSSPTEILALIYCRMKHIPYELEGDGAFYQDGNILKHYLKKFMMSKALLAFSTCNNHFEWYVSNGVNPSVIKKYPFSSIHKKSIKLITAEMRKEKKRKLHLQEEKILITVGQFIERKGFDLLLQAVKDFDDNIGIYLIGGKEIEEYHNIIKNYKNKKHIHFIDFLTSEELSQYYEAADLFVFPTREDIWGLVINEAMAYNLPVITTKRCNAGLELVEEGKTGYLVEANDIKALRNAIEKSFNMEFDSNAIYKKILKYTLETMTQAHIKYLKL